MKMVSRLATVAMLSAVLIGCSSTPEQATEVVEPAETQVQRDPNEGVEILDDCQPPCAFPKSALNDPQSPLAQRLVFFAYDSSDIAPEYEEVITNHARFLQSHPDVSVRLEGHTDERGSREYNLALGEQRAQAVQRLMVLQGAPAQSINVVSFGEEMPLDSASTEAAWQQNRRVEIVYDQN